MKDQKLTRADLIQIAREELVFTAKAFFAPVYGTWLVLSELMKR